MVSVRVYELTVEYPTGVCVHTETAGVSLDDARAVIGAQLLDGLLFATVRWVGSVAFVEFPPGIHLVERTPNAGRYHVG